METCLQFLPSGRALASSPSMLRAALALGKPSFGEALKGLAALAAPTPQDNALVGLPVNMATALHPAAVHPFGLTALPRSRREESPFVPTYRPQTEGRRRPQQRQRRPSASDTPSPPGLRAVA